MDGTMDLLGLLDYCNLTRKLLSLLDREDACILRRVSKSWRSRISFRYVMKLRRRRRTSPLLVLTDVIYRSMPENTTCRCERPDFFIADSKTHPLLPPVSSGGEEVKKASFSCDKVVFKHRGDDSFTRYTASCRDLMCFYTETDVYVYSPSTAQYLLYDCINCLESRTYKIGIVYIASIKVYKIVRIEFFSPTLRRPICPPRGGRCRPPGPSSPKSFSVRFKAITVHEDDDDRRCDVVGGDYDDKKKTSWELISDHTFPFQVKSSYGNLIGVNGVVYIIIAYSEPSRKRVLSLDIMEGDNNNKNKHEKLKIFDIPKVACPSRSTNTLSQVKDVLCFPEATTSCIVLWLLQDRNTGTWFKGYTISYIPRPYSVPEEVVYYLPITLQDDDGGDAGLFLFKDDGQLIQYDIRTKEAAYILPHAYMQQLHVFCGRLLSLKNGLRCPRVDTDIHPPELNCEMPPSPDSLLPPPPHPRTSPLHQGPLPIPPPLPHFRHPRSSLPPPPPPPHSRHPPPPQGSLPPQPPCCYPKPPQSSLPPPPPPPSPLDQYHQLPQGSIQPPPPPPQCSLPPPPSPLSQYHQLPQGSIQPPPPPPQCFLPPPPSPLSQYHQLPQGSIQPPPPQCFLPPPPYYHHNLQHTAYCITPHPPLTRGIPPPPLNTQNFQYHVYPPEVKRRKLNSDSVPPPPG